MPWKKRIISIALCLCALLCAASVRAEAADAHTNHLVCGGTTGTTCTHAGDKHTSNVPWTAWNGTTAIDNDFFSDSNTKYIYLSQDVEISDNWTNTKVPEGKTLYLCLNGHSLTRKASNYTIYVEGTLVLCDCNGSKQGKGAISHGKEDGSFCGTEGVYVMKNATFTMYGGKICNNNGGVLVSGGTFTMYGGEISHNKCITTGAEGGGGVWVKNGGSNIGNFAMYGGKISNNTYKGTGNCGGGGVYASGTGDFIIQGGKITDNQCSYNATNASATTSGGGLYITGQHNTLKIENNAIISNNTCDGEGGGIFINCQNVIGTITGCTISGNEAGGNGGGFASQDCILTIGNCNITNNKTMGKGGATAVGSWDEDSKITLSGSMNFSGNAQGCTADKNGKLTGDTANDVHLNTSRVYLRLASDFSKTSTAPIVVTTSSEPTNKTVEIAKGSASAAKTTDFTYGNDSTIGIIAKTNNGKVELLACKHSYSTQKDATNHWQECSICKDKKDATAHQYNQEKAETGCLKTAATCTAKAVYYKSCVCGATDTSAAETFESGNSLGHDFSVRQYGENDHWMKCSRCDATDTKEAHSGGEATCTQKAVCEKCGQKYGDLKAHDFANGPYRYDGEQHWKKCANCETTDTKYDHNLVHHDAQAPTPTPTEKGWYAYDACSDCDYTTKKEIPATCSNHYWKLVPEVSPTCITEGVSAHFECDNCPNKSVKDGVYDIVSDTELILAINPANHTGAPDSKWLSDSENHWQEYTCCHARANEAAHSGGAATCTAQAVCQVCGKAYGSLAAHDWQPATCTEPKTCSVCHTTEGAALGHDWGAWKVTTPATKDAPGVETRTCTHDPAHTETRSIPKLSTTVYTVSEDTKIAQIEAKVDGLDKILDSEENKQLAKDGKSVGVSLTVKNTASSGVSEKIKEKLAGSNMVGLRLELTVEKTVTANGVVESKQTIPDAGVLLKTTITLPTELQGKSGYVVYRLHGDAVQVLTETANANGEFITVSADKTQITICARLYSEYVIAYQTGGSSGGGYHPVNPTPVKATSANTGDAGVLLYGVTAALSLTGTAWLGAKSRKH